MAPDAESVVAPVVLIMFKKLYQKFDELHKFIAKHFNTQTEEHEQTRRLIYAKHDQVTLHLSNMSKTIESQQRTIEQLTNAMRDKYEHGLFVLSDDGTNFMVIKNGEEIVNDRVAYCRVIWEPGEAVTLETEYRV